MITRPDVARPRVAVIGGGTAGVSLAWLLDGACDVVLLEAQGRLGGHAHTEQVEHRGQPFYADLGAQFVSPQLEPAFMRFLQVLGIYDPKAPDSGATITREMGITVSDYGVARPRFVSPMFWSRTWPLVAPWNLPGSHAFFAYVRAVRRFEQEGDWSITLDEWLRSVPGLAAEPRERVVLPWITAQTGCSIDAARTLSARAALAPAARTLTEGMFGAYLVTNAVVGLGGVVEQIAARCTTLTVHRNAAAIALVRTAKGPCVITADGRREQVDHVVLAAPPHALTPLFSDDSSMRRWLERFTWFSSRLAIHDQPTFMPADRRAWSAYNALTMDGYCEASVWYGAIRDRMADGSTVDLFKSWVSARAHEPQGLLASAEYKHPLHTPDFVRAQNEVDARQGRDDVWFAGSWTRDIDLQETALLSAVWVAERLAPDAANLSRLTSAIVAR
jgi:predicted NAD/FAD-binding protein